MTIKRGIRKNKYQNVQIYFCKNCKKRFSENDLKHKSYRLKTITESLGLYNQGFSLDRLAGHTEIPRTTLNNWMQEYKAVFNILKFHRSVMAYSRENEIISGHRYVHKLVYHYYQNNFKLKRIEKKFPELFRYLNDKVSGGKIRNDIFNKSDSRASRTKLDIAHLVELYKLKNNACHFADIGQKISTSNIYRHPNVENLMLLNDTSTIACEVPVYLNTKKSSIPWLRNIKSANDYITGHIDILQYRAGKVFILDYKPGANKEKPLGQLFIYAACLSHATGVHFKNMRLAWFDENIYYETGAIEVYKYLVNRYQV
ncbi:MAG: hypothetical protein ACQES1_08650 [Bacteroidota bacterium]